MTTLKEHLLHYSTLLHEEQSQTNTNYDFLACTLMYTAFNYVADTSKINTGTEYSNYLSKKNQSLQHNISSVDDVTLTKMDNSKPDFLVPSTPN